MFTVTGHTVAASRTENSDQSRTFAISRSGTRTPHPDPIDATVVADRAAALRALDTAAAKQAKRIAAELSRWHLPVTPARVTATFGSAGGLWSHGHTGLDFAAPAGTPVVAITSGIVTAAGYDGAYGNKLVLTLEDGTELWFCHLTAFTADVDEEIRSGHQIGLVGSTGNTTGPHLHLEVRPGGGDPVDPDGWLRAHGLAW